MVSDAQVTMTWVAPHMHRGSSCLKSKRAISIPARELFERMQTYLIIIACSLAHGVAKLATDVPGQIFEEASSVRELEIIAGVHDFLTSATTLFEMKAALGRIKATPKTSMNLDDASLARVQQLGTKGMLAVAGLPWNVTSGAFLSMRKHLFSPAAHTDSLYIDAFKEGCGKFAQPLVSWADHTAGTHKAGSALHKATLHAGFGFGFGFQVWCGCNMLLSSGAGFGQGFSIYPNHEIDGGFGGGGGLEAFQKQGKSNKTAFHVGGGGGGDLTTCNTDEDSDQIIPKFAASMAGLQKGLILPLVKTCPKGDLSLVGSGEGSSSFALNWKTRDPVQFSEEFEITFASAYASGNDRRCSGIISKNAGDSKRESNISMTVQTECNKQCSGQPYSECGCPCMKKGYLRHNQSWAKKIECGSLANSIVV
ncbi:unnamed protein product [Symbiodinium necroappetens]|uniref:Uncharacterized protein n=1 Tax=Symbiodinium necroappetens TaxID=1628268 RepID=A0A812KRI2_9DINO|nr:unnamed protein product [Symbiodinium necroappetens]